MCIACSAAVWWSVDNASSVRHRLQTDIHNVVRLKYGRGASGATEAIVDKIQQDFECCGVKGISGTNFCFNQWLNFTMTIFRQTGRRQTTTRTPRTRQYWTLALEELVDELLQPFLKFLPHAACRDKAAARRFETRCSSISHRRASTGTAAGNTWKGTLRSSGSGSSLWQQL